MIKVKPLLLMAALCGTAITTAWAESLEDVEKRLRNVFSQTEPSLPIQSVAESAVPGLYSVKVENGPQLYSTADGKFFVLGDLYQVEQQRFVNIAEKDREDSRAKMLGSISVDDMIVFSPEKTPAKAVINVFTDVDCFYCQKLHREVPDLNRAGIEVRYLAYPRAGLASDSFKKIASAWCAKDKQAAMTRLKNRQSIPTNVCEGNPVKDQFMLGNQMGVNGTPALLTAEGKMMPGYMPALQLAKVLGVQLDPELEQELAVKQQAALQQ